MRCTSIRNAPLVLCLVLRWQTGVAVRRPPRSRPLRQTLRQTPRQTLRLEEAVTASADVSSGRSGTSVLEERGNSQADGTDLNANGFNPVRMLLGALHWHNPMGLVKKPVANAKTHRAHGNTTPPKEAVGSHVIVSDGKGHVLLIRSTAVPKWGYPGGFIDPGESAFHAMQREFREETGGRLPRLKGLTWFTEHEDKRHVIWVGKSTANFRKVISPDGRIHQRMLPAFTHKEADAWMWAKVDDVLNGKYTLRGGHLGAFVRAREENLI